MGFYLLELGEEIPKLIPVELSRPVHGCKEANDGMNNIWPDRVCEIP